MPHTTAHTLPITANDWPGLAAATLLAWHQQSHSRAGRQCITQARLCLGQAWAQAGRHNPGLLQLARRLAQDGVPVDVLVLPALAQPELRLAWGAWHAPPAPPPPPPPPLPLPLPLPLRPPPAHSSHPRKPPTLGATTMKVPFLNQLFNTNLAAAPSPGVPDEPSLQPLGVRARPGAGRQLAQAFAQIADQIAAQEVRDLLDLDTVGCRYQLWTLTFWVTAANQPALRSLVDVNLRDARVAKALIERNFNKSDNAHLLNTLRLKVDFQRGDSLPPDASEVLLVCGRDSVVLPFSYTGQIELGDASPAPRPAGAPQPPPPGTAPGGQTPAGAAANAQSNAQSSTQSNAQANAQAGTLLLWAQLPGQGGLQRWQFVTGPVTVGAADGASLCVDHHHVSGEHLAISQDSTGAWQVEDRSRNGSNLFDPSSAVAERPLPTRQPQALPPAGALRLGPLPDDPLLHFQVLRPAAPQPAMPDAASASPHRRVTQLAASPAPLALLPTRRVTGLS